MKLKDILNNIDCQIYGDENLDVKNLSHNSKEKNEDGVFFAISGSNFSGEDFILEAIEKGAKVIVSERKLETNITNIVVDDARKTMSQCASNFYNNPSKDMQIIGVTGTNGKTTTTYMLKSIFEEAGKKVGVIGTNGIKINNETIESNFTTPDPIIMQKTFAQMKEKGVDVVCMEISAHALELQKLWGVMCDVALFTNLTQDHLDYFKNMPNYFNAKKKLFTKDFAKFGVVNVDDPYGRELYKTKKIPMLSYARKNNVEDCKKDITTLNEKHNITNQEFDFITSSFRMHINLNMLGTFNISNALGAITAGIICGVDKFKIIKALEKMEKVDGRFNSYDVNGVRVIVDYAHTPDGLENILKSAREITDGKLISVFGCGGDRDKTKRPIMGEISSKYADFTILTSDNPRTEKPLDIINDIRQGFSNYNYNIVQSRINAINMAIKLAQEGDTVVIAGKGAEKYFDIDNKKVDYIGDGEVIENIIEKIQEKI